MFPVACAVSVGTFKNEGGRLEGSAAGLHLNPAYTDATWAATAIVLYSLALVCIRLVLI